MSYEDDRRLDELDVAEEIRSRFKNGGAAREVNDPAADSWAASSASFRLALATPTPL